MNAVTHPTCPACGEILHPDAIEGFCARCLAVAVLQQDAGESAADDFHSETGRRLGGYELLAELGRGGMGVVYRARQPGLSREVAVKVLLAGPFAGVEAMARFRREAGAAASLRHPNIVTIHEVGEADGHPFFSMELVEGETLADLTRDGPLEPRRAAGYLLLIARAIAAAHAQGVLHRDLKPGNIIVDRDDQPRVTDFGLARRLDDLEHTQTRQLAGSPGYLPPEQADPARGPVGITADVYALGATLYHLLTGRPPFAAATATATLQQVLRDEPAALRKLNSLVPRDLETICLKCLRKESNQRYASADELAADLAAFLEQRPIRARPVSTIERAWLWTRRRPALAGVSLALVLAVVAGAAVILWQWRDSRDNLYAADLRVAAEAIELGDLGRARELLALHESPEGHTDFTWRLLRQLAAGDPRRVLGEHPWIVGAVAWSADGQRIASASVGSGTVDADIRVWDPLAAAAEPLILSTNGTRELTWFPGHTRLLAVHFGGRVRIWNVASRSVEQEFAGRSAGLSADGRWLVTCEGDPFAWNDDSPAGPVTLHDLQTGDTRTLGDARYVALSPGGRWLARARFDGRIELIALADGAIRELACDLMIWGLRFAPDDSQLIATGFGETPLLWPLDEPDAPPLRLRGHTLNTWRAAFSPDGRRVATTSSDQSLRLWDTRTGELLGQLRGHASEVWSVAFAPDGDQLVSGGKDRAVIVWSPDEQSRIADFATPPYSRALFASAGNAMAVPGVDDWSEWRWFAAGDDHQTGRVRIVGVALAIEPDAGHLLVAAGNWQLHQQTMRDPVANPDRPVIQLEHAEGEQPPLKWAASRDGRHVAGVTAAGEVSLWQIPSGRKLRHVTTSASAVEDVELSLDLEAVVITGGEAGFWLSRLADGRVFHLTGHLDQGKAAAFSPDSRHLATASVDGTVKLWDAANGRELFTFRGHRTGVSGVAFAPDGVTLASCEPGVGLRFWHLPTSREIAVLNIADAGEWIGFVPDGKSLAMQVDGGGIRLLPAP